MTIDKIKEKYLPVISALVVVGLNYQFEFSQKLDMGKFVDKAIDISSISFGFLLAVLALLLQTNNSKIERIKVAGRFSELISFNKKAVSASALLAIISLFYVSSNLQTYNCQLANFSTLSCTSIADLVFFAVFAYQISVVYLFLDLFYFIIK